MTSRRGYSKAIAINDDIKEHYSDSEMTGNYFQSSSLPVRHGYTMLGEDGNNTDEESNRRSYGIDEFGDINNKFGSYVRTGRQRKKFAARSKGGEFQTKRKKRRVYFCCVSSDIDVQKLYDYLVGAGGLLNGWQFQIYCDVLHLYKSSGVETDVDSPRNIKPLSPEVSATTVRAPINTTNDILEFSTNITKLEIDRSDHFRMSGQGAQEVFVFDFGAAVFWGFSRGEETNLLKTIRMFVTKGFVGATEFQSGEDDMAFVTSPETDVITIANDVITIPEDSVAKQRLSVSFAIAQSSVLAIFEARIERKVEEYKYIPESLAACGKVHLSERQLGIMIGEVFVIRHDVNLHTEILDTPDFFWKEEKFEQDYKLVMRYLEMSARTEVLNKRLDMLRELLDVLQQQMENSHAVKLEWIVIWLIIVEVVLQIMVIGIDFINKK